MDFRYTSREFCVSQEQLDRFSAASGGIGKIHTDPAYAGRTRFGGTLVHGMLICSLIEQVMELNFQNWFDKGTLDMTFMKPVRSGESFYFRLEQRSFDEICVEVGVEVVCCDQVVMAGKVAVAHE